MTALGRAARGVILGFSAVGLLAAGALIGPYLLLRSGWRLRG